MRVREDSKHEIRKCKAKHFEEARAELRDLGIKVLDWWRSGDEIVMKCMKPKEAAQP